MISGFKGRIIYTLDNFLYVQNNDALCEIVVENPKEFSLGTEYFFYLYVQKQITKYIESVVNFGFIKLEDVLIFKKLIEIKGVGLKTAYRLIKSDFSRLINLARQNRPELIQEEYVLSSKTANSICQSFAHQEVLDRSAQELKQLKTIINYLTDLGYNKSKIKSVVYQYGESLLNDNFEEIIPLILKKLQNE